MIILTGVTKYIVLFAMAMQVKTALYFIVIFVIVYTVFNLIYLRIHEPRCLLPPSVKVSSSNITPKITIDNSIHIDHGIYLENIIWKKPVYALILLGLQKFSYHFLDHVWRPNLARMLSSHHNDHFLIDLTFFCYRNLWNIITTNWCAYRFDTKLNALCRILLC